MVVLKNCFVIHLDLATRVGRPMRNLYSSVTLLSFCFSIACVSVGQASPLQISFASVETGQGILGKNDEFIQRLSPFDRASRLKTDRNVSKSEFVRFAISQVRCWEAGDKTKILEAFDRIQPKLGELSLSWPRTVHLIKTSGKEEGYAAYTRERAIVIPEVKLTLSIEKLSQLAAHELFHILSRYNPVIRDRLYLAIGFERCHDTELPINLTNRRITNPDAPLNAHCIRIQYQCQPFWALPVLFSKNDRYDPKQGETFFQYLQFRLMLVRTVEGDLHVGTSPHKLVKVNEVSGFFEQVGKNTNYIIHPEEIIADHFALIVMGETQFKSPEVVDKIKAVLRKGGEVPY